MARKYPGLTIPKAGGSHVSTRDTAHFLFED
jgi:hypothetical protein